MEIVGIAKSLMGIAGTVSTIVDWFQYNKRPEEFNMAKSTLYRAHGVILSIGQKLQSLGKTRVEKTTGEGINYTYKLLQRYITELETLTKEYEKLEKNIADQKADEERHFQQQRSAFFPSTQPHPSLVGIPIVGHQMESKAAEIKKKSENVKSVLDDLKGAVKPLFK